MLDMFLSFQCTKYGDNRWLNTKLFLKKKEGPSSPKKTMRVFCVFYRDWSLQMGQMGPKNDPGHPDNEWG